MGSLEGGVIIRLPLVDIEDTLDQVIDLRQLNSDERLIQLLEEELAR